MTKKTKKTKKTKARDLASVLIASRIWSTTVGELLLVETMNEGHLTNAFRMCCKNFNVPHAEMLGRELVARKLISRADLREALANVKTLAAQPERRRLGP